MDTGCYMIRECKVCGFDYDDRSRKGKPGLIIHCNDCAEEDETRFTGVMIYTHKTGPSIQINKDPELTNYIINSTKLKNKGSNLGNNLKVSGRNHGEGRCLTTVSNSNAKGKGH